MWLAHACKIVSITVNIVTDKYLVLMRTFSSMLLDTRIQWYGYACWMTKDNSKQVEILKVDYRNLQL